MDDETRLIFRELTAALIDQNNLTLSIVAKANQIHGYEGASMSLAHREARQHELQTLLTSSHKLKERLQELQQRL